MKQNILAVTLALAACSPVVAQQQPGAAPRGPYSRPTVSPYINLLRRGSLIENYYGLTRPQVRFQNEAQRLQQEISQTRQDTTEAFIRRDLPSTGHATSFLNTGGYFLGRGGRGVQASPQIPNAGPMRQPSRGRGR